MAVAPEIVRMTAPQVEEAGDMLGRAFFDNPMALYLLPRRERSGATLSWMFETITRYGDLYGEVYTTSGKIRRRRNRGWARTALR